MALDESILEQAARWAVRTGDPAFEDWEDFTLWLEADPRHAQAYDIVCTSVGDAAVELAAEPQGANDDDRDEGSQIVRLTTRRRWFGGAIAASLAAVFAFGFFQMQDGTYVVETEAGETRLVDLPDGGQIALGGGTRLTLDGEDPRFAELERGQALFTITHDEARPFRVNVGEDELVDLGTVFDVRHDGRETTVAVSEGLVSFNPNGPNIRIDPGKALTSAQGSAEYRLFDVPLGQVGEWRQGRLTFQNATLAAVADDLTRATGIPFSAAAGAAARRVSGSVLVAPVKADPRGVGQLLGVAVRQSGKGWVIEGQ